MSEQVERLMAIVPRNYRGLGCLCPKIEDRAMLSLLTPNCRFCLACENVYWCWDLEPEEVGYASAPVKAADRDECDG